MSCTVQASPALPAGLKGVLDVLKQLWAPEDGSPPTDDCSQTLPWASGTLRVLLCQGPSASLSVLQRSGKQAGPLQRAQCGIELEHTRWREPAA